MSTSFKITEATGEKALAALIKARVPGKAKFFAVTYEGKTKPSIQPMKNLDVQYGVNCSVEVSEAEEPFVALELKADAPGIGTVTTEDARKAEAEVEAEVGKEIKEVLADAVAEAGKGGPANGVSDFLDNPPRTGKVKVEKVNPKEIPMKTNTKKTSKPEKAPAKPKHVRAKVRPGRVEKKPKATIKPAAKKVKATKPKPKTVTKPKKPAAPREASGMAAEIDTLLNLSKYTLGEATEILSKKHKDKEATSIRQQVANRPNTRRYRGEKDVPSWVPSDGKTGFSRRMDSLLVDAGGKTFSELLAVVMKEFPGKDATASAKLMRNRARLLGIAGKKVNYIRVIGKHADPSKRKPKAVVKPKSVKKATKSKVKPKKATPIPAKLKAKIKKANAGKRK